MEDVSDVVKTENNQRGGGGGGEIEVLPEGDYLRGKRPFGMIVVFPISTGGGMQRL